jgi:ABC-type Mn2+/Zn2+ transport system ATPase subunit
MLFTGGFFMQKETLIDVRDVGISIAGKPIISNANLRVNKGDFIFLSGRNGSGKSSFLDVIAKCDKFTETSKIVKYEISGEIIYDNGKDIVLLENEEKQEYKRGICYVPQISIKINNTVGSRFEIAMSDVRDIDQNYIFDFLNRIDAAFFFPQEDLKQLIRRKISLLSEGQKKMIELFAGIMRAEHSKLLLIDEPLNHLDTGNVRRIVGLFSELRDKNSELAVIVTTHCQAFPAPTKYLIVHNGAIIESDDPYTQGKCFINF